MFFIVHPEADNTSLSAYTSYMYIIDLFQYIQNDINIWPVWRRVIEGSIC